MGGWVGRCRGQGNFCKQRTLSMFTTPPACHVQQVCTYGLRHADSRIPVLEHSLDHGGRCDGQEGAATAWPSYHGDRVAATEAPGCHPGGSSVPAMKAAGSYAGMLLTHIHTGCRVLAMQAVRCEHADGRGRQCTPDRHESRSLYFLRALGRSCAGHHAVIWRQWQCSGDGDAAADIRLVRLPGELSSGSPLSCRHVGCRCFYGCVHLFQLRMCLCTCLCLSLCVSLWECETV